MEDINRKLEELKVLGFTQSKLDALMALAFEDFMEMFNDDLVKLELEDIEDLEKGISSLTITDLMSTESKVAENVFSKVYGLSYRSKVEGFLNEYLDDTLNQANAVKELYTKMQNGDTSAVNDLDNDPNKAAVEEALKAASEM